MLEPSVSAPMIAIFLSVARTFALTNPLCNTGIRVSQWFLLYIFIVLEILLLFALILYATPVKAASHPREQESASYNASPTPTTSQVAAPQQNGAELQPKGEEHVRADVVVVSTPIADTLHDPGFW